MKKSQASVEYLMVVGLAFIIVLPMVYMFYSYSSSMQEEVSMSKIHKIGTDIVYAAEQTYYLGEPSRATINLNMPNMVYDVSIINAGAGYKGSLLVFYYGDNISNQPIVIPSRIPLSVDLGEEYLSPGKKIFVVEARENTVLVRGKS